MDNKKNILFVLLLLVTSMTYSQKGISYKSLFKNDDYSSAVKMATSGNSYDFMSLRKYIGALNVMIKETNDEVDILELTEL